MPLTARTLGSWVRIPLKAWISVCVYSVFALGSDLCHGLIPCPRSPTDCLRLRNWSETKRFTDVLCSKWEQQEQKKIWTTEPSIHMVLGSVLTIITKFSLRPCHHSGGYSPSSHLCGPGSVPGHMRLIMDTMTLKQVFFEYFSLPYQLSFEQLLHIH
jgi:hypothetical protein